MQIAGIGCQCCGLPVILESEGRGCRQCQAVYHKGCLPAGDVVCQCGSLLLEKLPPQVFALRCPVCGLRNENPPTGACGRCGDVKLGFDSPEDFQKERRRVHRVGWGRLAVAGMLGVIALLMFTAAYFVTPAFSLLWFTGVPLIAAGAACATGVMALFKAVKVAAEGIACLRYR